MFEDSDINLVELFLTFYSNNGKLKNNAVTVFPQEIRSDRHQIRKFQKIFPLESYACQTIKICSRFNQNSTVLYIFMSYARKI